MHNHSIKEPHGIRWFWNIDHRRGLRIEFYWWSARFGASLASTDEGWTASMRIPPFAIWVTLEGLIWQPKETHIATWDGNRSFTLPSQRSCDFYISDWMVSFTPWGRSMEWHSSDPWWVRGLSFDIRDVILGHMKYTTEEIGPSVPIEIIMPEGRYPAVATLKRATRTRPRWPTSVERYYDVRVPKGVPFAGKGENSYDCDDDGLYGYSSHHDDLTKVAEEGAAYALERRVRYGKPSQASIDEALRA